MSQIAIEGALGVSATWVNAIPAGSLLMGVSEVITASITDPLVTGYTVGTAAAADLFVDTNDITKGDSFDIVNQLSTLTSPEYYFAVTNIVVIPKGSGFTQGKLKLAIYYFELVAPTV